MPGCCVEITGKDGKKHILTVNACSTFDAVGQAINAWGRLWWFDSETVAIVRINDQIWSVSVRKVCNWQVQRAVDQKR